MQKNKRFILSENVNDGQFVDKERRVAIIVCLYYEDTLDRYIKYISDVGEGIDVYIITSNDKVYSRLTEMQFESNTTIIKKENRGRDISALLVTAKPYIFKYDFFCFVHDKKEKRTVEKEETELWIKDMWDNLLKNKSYINNVLKLFDDNEEVGLLVPPLPVMEICPLWRNYNWGNNFEITKDLADRMQLQCELKYDVSPVALGTAFWCRTKALEKLLKWEWHYEDFPQEPMPDDGTISHAIERILSYVAEDAGYSTGIAMCIEYAHIHMNFYEDNLRQVYDWLSANFRITSSEQLKSLDKKIEYYKDFCGANNKVYMYGAGVVGKQCLNFLKLAGINVNGFVQTSGGDDMVYGLPLITIDDIKCDDVGIIVTVTSSKKQEIHDVLESKGITNYIDFVE